MTETPLPSPETTLATEAQGRLHDEVHARYSRRILWLTLALGLSTAVVVGVLKTPRWGIGIAVGTLLAWLNYNWLDQALGGLVTSATAQEGSPKAIVPLSLYAKFIGRYLLIGLVLYVIVGFFRVPILACLVGLLALGSGTITASLYDVFSGND